jgi:hypothetical protein
MSNLSAISWREQATFRRDNDGDKVRFVLDQHTELDFYSSNKRNTKTQQNKES